MPCGKDLLEICNTPNLLGPSSCLSHAQAQIDFQHPYGPNAIPNWHRPIPRLNSTKDFYLRPLLQSCLGTGDPLPGAPHARTHAEVQIWNKGPLIIQTCVSPEGFVLIRGDAWGCPFLEGREYPEKRSHAQTPVCYEVCTQCSLNLQLGFFIFAPLLFAASATQVSWGGRRWEVCFGFCFHHNQLISHERQTLEALEVRQHPDRSRDDMSPGQSYECLPKRAYDVKGMT